jgi:hypothetical protein
LCGCPSLRGCADRAPDPFGHYLYTPFRAVNNRHRRLPISCSQTFHQQEAIISRRSGASGGNAVAVAIVAVTREPLAVLSRKASSLQKVGLRNPHTECQKMPSRPLGITVVAALFLVGGVIGVGRTFTEGALHRAFLTSGLWVLLLNLVAFVCGIFLWLGRDWARWLAVAWMAAHVSISLLNSLQEAMVHCAFLLLIAYMVFRPDAQAWFRARKSMVNKEQSNR